MNKVSNKILDKILTDNDFSIRLAQVMQITQQSVKSLARRKSTKLTLYSAVDFYRNEGFSINEIFERYESSN